MESLLPDIVAIEAGNLVNQNYEVIDAFDNELERQGYVEDIRASLKLVPDHLVQEGRLIDRTTAVDIACTALDMLHKDLEGYGTVILSPCPGLIVRYYTVTRDDFKTYYVSESYTYTSTGLKTGISAQLVVHMPVDYQNALQHGSLD